MELIPWIINRRQLGYINVYITSYSQHNIAERLWHLKFRYDVKKLWLGSSFRRFSSMGCSNINANRHNEFHHATPHKNAATVVPWYRKTCRSECMFVPVVDSSATEMSTQGAILLTGWAMNSSRDTRCWSTIPQRSLRKFTPVETWTSASMMHMLTQVRSLKQETQGFSLGCAHQALQIKCNGY